MSCPCHQTVQNSPASSDTMAELKQMMENNTTVLSQVVQRTSQFRNTRKSRAPESIFDLSSKNSFRLGDGDSVFSTTFFLFDNELLNSTAYRRVLAKVEGERNDGEQLPSTTNEDGTTQAKEQMLSTEQSLFKPGTSFRN